LKHFLLLFLVFALVCAPAWCQPNPKTPPHSSTYTGPNSSVGPNQDDYDHTYSIEWDWVGSPPYSNLIMRANDENGDYAEIDYWCATLHVVDLHTQDHDDYDLNISASYVDDDNYPPKSPMSGWKYNAGVTITFTQAQKDYWNDSDYLCWVTVYIWIDGVAPFYDNQWMDFQSFTSADGEYECGSRKNVSNGDWQDF
jgi:hypothetical protein